MQDPEAQRRREEGMKNLLALGQAGVPEGAPTMPALSSEEDALLADPARRFGRYAILRELGRGGMGVVYRAWDTRLRRAVALKMAAQVGPEDTAHAVPPSHAAAAGLAHVDPSLVERLKREAQAASRLSHPNLIRIIDAGICEGIFYFTMDLLDGTPVDGLPLPMPEREAIRIVAAVARAVAYAHTLGVVHRDIKPSNILLTPRQEPILIDFGLAKDLTAPSITVTGDLFGTPWYMAPEQAQGNAGRVGAKADTYSLGATLYHLVAGKPPYADLAAGQVLVAVTGHPPYPPSTLNPSIHPELEGIILKAMATDPERRHATAEALADDLRRLLARMSEVAIGPRAVARSRMPSLHRRAGLAWAWVLAVTVSLCTGVGLAIWRSDLGRMGPEAPSQPMAFASSPAPRKAAARPSTPAPQPWEPAPTVQTPAQAPVPAPPTPQPASRPVPPPATPPPPRPAPAPAPTPAPEEKLPAEARKSQEDGVKALDAALAMTFADRAEDWRAKLAEAVSRAEAAIQKAPSWPAPKRLRADALFALGRYADASDAYSDYAAATAPPVLPAEALEAEFLEWFRLSRPWAEDVPAAAAKRGSALADRIEDAARGDDPLEASPFLPWRPGSAAGAAVDPRAVRADLLALSALAREDWEEAGDLGRTAAKAGGGLAACLSELMRWQMVDSDHRPDTLLLEMHDRHVRTPEAWLVVSWGLGSAGDATGAERAAVRALAAREGDPPPEVRSAAGLVAWRKGDNDRAKDEWTAAQSADPTRRAYLADLGAICLVRDEMDEAIPHLKAALLKTTSPDPPSDRLSGFVDYEIACADARLLGGDPRPKEPDRSRLAAEALACMRQCLKAMSKLPHDADDKSREAPRICGEWTSNDVRQWALSDPWLEGLQVQPTEWRALKEILK